MEAKAEAFHSGFIALVGRPNVGKSTLMNAVLGEKICIAARTDYTKQDYRGMEWRKLPGCIPGHTGDA